MSEQGSRPSSYRELEADLAAAHKERDEWREEAWRCYVESGADPDGADARHLNPGEALAAVEELRRYAEEESDEQARQLKVAGDEWSKTKRQLEAAHKLLREWERALKQITVLGPYQSVQMRLLAQEALELRDQELAEDTEHGS